MLGNWLRLSSFEHPAFFRVFGAIDTLINSVGKDSKKLHIIRNEICVLLESDFNTDKEKKIFQEILKIYIDYPPPEDVDWSRGQSQKCMNNAHWRMTKKLKKLITELFSEICSFER